MSIAWPESLPCPRFGITYTVVDPQLRTPQETGYATFRRKLTAVPVDFSARWIMSSTQGDEFETFYREILMDGTLWFSIAMVVVQSNGPQFVRFMGPYSYQKVGNDLWEYSANMQMYLRPGSYALPPLEEGST